MLRKFFVIPVLLLCLCMPLPGSAEASATNLVAGMAYTIENSVPTTHSYSNFTEDGVSYDTEDLLGISGKLTDGIRAKGGIGDPAWYTTFRSRSRYVTFSFDAPVAVEGFSAGFCRKVVNPTEPIGLGGYGSEARRVTLDIMDDICVSVTALCDGENVVIFISSDTLHTSYAVYEKAAKLLEEKFGI